MKLGHTNISIGKIAFGCSRFAKHDTGMADRIIRTALDAGMNLIDTADIYGLGKFPNLDTQGFGEAEIRLGQVLATSPSLRKQIVLATKGGIDAVTPYNSSYAYLMRALEASLDRLQTDYVDLYHIHRPDLTTPMSEVARALNEMIESGKIRSIGVSNFTVPQMRTLQTYLNAPISGIQPEFSALEQSALDNGILDFAEEIGATVLAWSPLAGGNIATTDGPVQNVLDRIAVAYGISRSTAALSFLRGFGAAVVPIIGTQNPTRITESGYAAQVNLTRREIYDIVEAYRGVKMP